MVRPRWHDALIIIATVVVLSFGAAALWWGDMWGYLGSDGSGSEQAPAPVAPGKV